jgi:molybdenum cofactor biosynthesis protein B
MTATAFIPLHIAVLTVSDSRQVTDDVSGNELATLIAKDGHQCVDRKIVKDDQRLIVEQLHAWIADKNVDVVVATGGTGVTGRDVTPEAFHAVYEKEISCFVG